MIMRKSTAPDGSYLFQVAIQVSAANNGEALEKLLKVLNNGDFKEYRIESGIQGPSDPMEGRIRQYIDDNRLTRLNVNKGRGVKMSIPCRILNYDSSKQLLTVYHVDQKQVYSFELYEIDDFIE
jgi:hypothetical protein